jgi:hypothetical protein
MLIVCYYLLAIDSNDNKCTEEGEVFEYQEEEDQGHANQGNPSNFVAYLNPSFTPHDLLRIIKMHDFILLLLLNNNCWRLSSTSQLLSSLWMTPPLTPIYPPELGARWLSSMPLEKLVVEQKL